MSDYLSGLGLPNVEPLNNADPQDTEDASSLGPAVRQIKSIIYAFLAVSFNTGTGELLADAITAAMVGDGEVSGSVSNDPSALQGKIKVGTVSTNDFRDGAVSTNKLADLAVTAAKIAVATITSAKIANSAIITALVNDLAITTAKINDLAVTSGKIADLAVTTGKVADLAVTGAKMADNTIGPDKFSITPSAGQLLVGQTGSPKWAAKSMSGAATIDANGVVTMVGGLTVAYGTIRERVAKGSDAGASTAAVDLTAAALTGIRGSSAAWVIGGNLSSSISGAADGTLTLARAGTYVFMANAPAYSVGLHKLAIQRYNAAVALQETLYGTNCYAPPGHMTTSQVFAVMAVVAGDKVRLRHYTELARSNGLGVATNATGTTEEVYATINVLQV